MASISVQPVAQPTFDGDHKDLLQEKIQVTTTDHVPSEPSESSSDNGNLSDHEANTQKANELGGHVAEEQLALHTDRLSLDGHQLASWVKDQSNLPYWARIYPVSYPSFEEVSKGKKEDKHAPTPEEEFPSAQASEEERARRGRELEELGEASKVKRPLDEDFEPNYKYAWALPWFDERYKSKHFKDGHFSPFEHHDVGLRALTHEDPESFLHKPGVQTEDLSPGFGTRVTGLDLTQLTAREKDQLALFISQRGVVVFEDQEPFIDQTPEKLKDYGYHFSQKLHVHQVSGQPKDHPEFHLVYRSPKWPLDSARTSGRWSNKAWHSDISFEAQPAGPTALFLFDSPASGGDTLFNDQEEVLRRVSPSFRSYLSTLEAEHDGFFQVALANSSKTGVARRPPVAHIHPVVRTHPVTGRESLYVSESFTKRIVGLKHEESEALLSLLKKLVNDTVDAQVRVKWGPKAVVWWDNRRTSHTASYASSGKQERRHGARITPQAERPFYLPRPKGFFVEQQEEDKEETKVSV